MINFVSKRLIFYLREKIRIYILRLESKNKLKTLIEKSLKPKNDICFKYTYYTFYTRSVSKRSMFKKKVRFNNINFCIFNV